MHSLVQPRRSDRHYALSSAAYDATLDALEASAGVFRNRSEAMASIIPAGVDRIAVRHGPSLLWYLHDPDGTAMQTAGGRWWSPADIATPMHWGAAADGTGDDGPAIAATLAWSRHVHLAGATYRVQSRAECTRPGRVIEATGATIICDDALGGNPAIRFLGDGTGQDVATVRAAIAAGADTITMDDTSAIAAGDWLMIASTEYKMGVTGVPGHGVRTKGEYVEVREVVSATQIVVVGTVDDSYSVAGETVTLRKVAFLHGAEVIGGTWWSTFEIGAGNPPGQSNRNFRQRAIVFDGVLGAKVSGARFLNFSDDIISMSRSSRARVSDNEMIGPTGATSRLPSEDQLWGKGVGIFDAQGVVFTGNACRRLRRPVDGESASGSGIFSRRIVMSDNIIEGCYHFIGTHACDGLIAVGNEGSAYSFGTFRGVNAIITGNRCIGVQGSAALTIGLSPSNSSHAETPDHGRIVITDNIVEGVVDGDAIGLRGSVEAMIVHGNTWPRSLNGLRIRAKRIGTLRVTGNVFFGQDTATPDEDQETPGTGIVVSNQPNVPLEAVGSIVIDGNTFDGLFRDGAFIMGTGSGAGAGPVAVTNNIFERVMGRLLSFAERSNHISGVNGHFAVPPVQANNVVRVHDSPDDAIFEPPNGGWAVLAPVGMNPLAPSTLRQLSFVRPSAATGETAVRLSRSILRGTRIVMPAPGPGEPAGYVCTRSGTRGTLSGVTGSIAAGSDQLTVNNASNIFVGSHVTVAGAGLPDGTRVVARHGNVLTLNMVAAASVNGAAVMRVAPEFRGCGTVEI